MRPEHWLFTIPLRLRSLFRWARADQELDDELREHLERKTEEYVAQGMAQAEARRRASSGATPLATYSWVFRSRWSRSSSSNCCSACARRNNDRNRSGIVYSQCSGRILPPSFTHTSEQPSDRRAWRDGQGRSRRRAPPTLGASRRPQELVDLWH